MTDSGNGYGLNGQTTWGSAIGSTGVSTVIQNCVAHDNRGEGINPGWRERWRGRREAFPNSLA